MLGEEYEAFLGSYEEKRRPGLRVNTLKEGTADIPLAALFGLCPVPWVPNGYFYDPGTRPGKHPFHEAGAYYIQEPSAMAVAALSGVRPGMRVLDLCAAPGGKSTQIASMLAGSGVLFSNEIHPVRAKILSQNIERMGITNAIVLNEEPRRLADRFPLYFDTVVVDAPCSGEGMFRKEDEAVPNWSPENVQLCAQRQSRILDCAAEMTAAGGTLVYSTCTFAPMENELNGEPRFAQGEDIPDEIRESLKGSIRLWPHRLEGEGHYLAVFRKSGTALKRKAPAARPVRDKEALRLWKEFCEETLTKSGADRLKSEEGAALLLFGKELYRIPEAVSLDGLKVMRPGLHLGTLKKNRFEPAHALALALRPCDVRCSAETSKDPAAGFDDMGAVCAYLRGESIPAQDSAKVKGEKGWCLVTDHGLSFGWGKLSLGQIKNHYPKGLRRPY